MRREVFAERMREHDSVFSELLAAQPRLGVFGQSKPFKRVIKCVLNHGNPLKGPRKREKIVLAHI